MTTPPPRPTFRFAPSPNGALHLGHAYSALMNQRLAAEVRGRLLLRIEDLDRTRCKREYEQAILDDLNWLGLVFDGPPRRQSEHRHDYAGALARLSAQGLVYPCFCSRARNRRHGRTARDPDGAPLYSGPCRALSARDVAARLAAGERAALRLDAARALAEAPADLCWPEYGEGAPEAPHRADPAAWGDFVLRGKDNAASYHLAVSSTTRCRASATSCAAAICLPRRRRIGCCKRCSACAAPRYRHHRLVLDAKGAKMSKSASSPSLRALRAAGYSALEVRAALGFAAPNESRLTVSFS